MGDITITVPISTVFKEVARRSSVATETDPFYLQKSTEDKQYSQLHGEGDRITSDFTREAAKEVLKAYLSRQGDVDGIAYEYDRAIPASETAVKQRDIIVLSGYDGYGYIMDIVPENRMITFDTDLLTTAQNFVSENEAYYLENGIVLTSLEGGPGVPYAAALAFEAAIAGIPFTSPTLSLTQLSINGETQHITENAVITIPGTSTGTIVYRFAENPVPLSSRQTNAIVERLTNNTRDAIVYYVLVSLYRTDGNQNKEKEVLAKALSLIDELSGDLYRLHD